MRRKLARARPQLVLVEGQVSAIVVARSDDVAKKITNEFLHLMRIVCYDASSDISVDAANIVVVTPKRNDVGLIKWKSRWNEIVVTSQPNLHATHVCI